jgi:transcriptional regulator with GAF, ATPase, and Fis domain
MFPNHALRNAIEEYFAQVFSAHRQAIRKTIKEPNGEESIGANESLHCTINALMQCSFLMNADLSIERVLRQIMNEARNLLGAEAASVFLVDSAKQELFSNVNSTDGELRIPISKGIAGHVASTGEALIIDNAYNDDRFNPANDVKTGFRTDNMICVPLKQKKGNVIGVVQLINKDASGVFSRWQARSADSSRPNFTQQDMQFLEVFASQAATAVANSGDMSYETQAPRQKQNNVEFDDEQPVEKPPRQISFTKISLSPCFEDVEAAKPSFADADDSVVRTTSGRKKSGRARQRTAKWWASVRRKTPSPEPVKELRWCHTKSI